MTERQQAILVAIIEQYAEIAAPVGSVTLAKLFGVSSATIRSEMAKLEEMGFIEAPHTSAGRIPTDKGYRFFVDNFVDSSHRDSKIEASVSLLEPQLENVLEKTVQLISAHTKLTAVAVGKSSKSRIISDLHLSNLDDSRYVLAVIFNVVWDFWFKTRRDKQLPRLVRFFYLP